MPDPQTPVVDTATTLLPTLIEGLHHIGALSQVQASHAQAALTLISRVYETLRAALTEEISPEAAAGALKTLKALNRDLAQRDAKADAELAARFDDSEKV